MSWNLAQAKEHLEEIAERAANDEVQVLQIGGAELAVLPVSTLRRLEARVPTMKELIADLGDISDIHFDRDQTPVRDRDL